MRRVIVTGDDFGLAVPVNEAIEEAHRRGVLTTASLMVGAPAFADAVARAKALPSLHVGLHLVLVEGRPVSDPSDIPHLVDARGEFSTRLVREGFRFFLLPDVRRDLAREIRAQFDAFRKTGLRLDHVNTHNHMHLHPTVLSLLLQIGREYGAPAIRVPYEPPGAFSFGRLGAEIASWIGIRPWALLARRRIRRAGFRCNDFVVGLHDSGRMHGSSVYRSVRRLPEGLTEMYFHPATRRCPELDRHMPDYAHEREFQTLVSPVLQHALHEVGARLTSYSELAGLAGEGTR